MCGIAGIASDNAKEHQKALENMTACLAHRGPDGQNISFFTKCGLGHRRLSIVDLATGDQPMFSADRKKAITFNGEIFGYKDIRASLAKEYKFKTTSDTEVVLALYEKHGDDFMTHLPGQFAFALWDDVRQKLVAARDRFGEKPFYYAFGPNKEFVFASEIKSLLASELIQPILSKSSVAHYLKHLYVHPHTTIYENVFVLPPAHMLTWEAGKLTVRRYWEMPAVNETISLDDAVPVFKKLLNKAVENQLVADVPVGAFLSGGLDSSTIVALASRHTEHLQTFSFGFKGAGSETAFAREIASRYGTNHRELHDEGDNIGALLVKMQEVYDEPFADSSNITTYLISKLSRQFTKVALTGDGGDEFLGGYGWYKPYLHFGAAGVLDPSALLRHSLIGKMAKGMRRSGANTLFGKVGSSLHNRHHGASMQKQYGDVFEAHLAQSSAFTDEEISSLGLVEKEQRHTSSWQLTGTLDDAIRLDVENYMPGDILVKTDRASMAHGLELRAPFLDKDLAEFCLTLPYQLKITSTQDKLLLREAFQHLWTDSIRKRGKQGFGAPVTEWLKQPSVKALVEEYLNDPAKKIFILLSFDAVQGFVKKGNYRTWTLLVLSMWLEAHLYT